MSQPTPYNGKDAPIPVPDLENWNTDRSVSPPTMVRGGVYKTSGGSWTYNDGKTVITDRVNDATISTDGELSIKPNNKTSTSNTSTTALGIDEVFTGTWEDSLDYGVIIIGIHTDQNSATDGLVIQWSENGSHVSQDDKFTILANNGKVFTFSPPNRYFRIIYTNGGTAQTEMELEVTLKRFGFKPSSHRIQDSIVAEDDAELVKAVITGESADGVFRNTKVDSEGKLEVVSQPYTYSIAEGTVLNHTPLLKFGTRTSIAAGTQSTVWEGPTDIYSYLSSAEQLKITSTDNTNDNVGGTGALTLTLVGLNGSWNEITEVVTMTGTTAVTTTNSFIRIFRAYVTTCGTSLTNTGTISIKNNASTVTQAIINIGDGQTLMSLWTVPLAKKAYLLTGTLSTDSNKGVRVSFFTRLNDGGTLYPWQIKYRAYIFSGNEIFPFQIPFAIPAKTDVEVRVTTPASAGTTSAGATFELWYEDV